MFPDSGIRIQQVFRVEEVDVDQIVRIISSDPAIAARVLQLANSAALRAVAEITDVRQAERNEALSVDARAALKAIWDESAANFARHAPATLVN